MVKELLGLMVGALASLAMIHPAAAQLALEGQSDWRRAEIPEPNKTLTIPIEYQLKWKITTLFQEPVVHLEFRWHLPENVSVPLPVEDGDEYFRLADLDPEARRSVNLYDVEGCVTYQLGLIPYKFCVDVGVPHNGVERKWSFNVPESPDWHNLIQSFSGFYSADEARAALKRLIESNATTNLSAEVNIIGGRWSFSKVRGWWRSNYPVDEYIAYSKALDSQIRNIAKNSSLERSSIQSLEVKIDALRWYQHREHSNIAPSLRKMKAAFEKLQTLPEGAFASDPKHKMFASEAKGVARAVQSEVAERRSEVKKLLEAAKTEEAREVAEVEARRRQLMPKGPTASLLMLIDTSGSMSGKRLSAAKRAAVENVRRLVGQGTEVAILAFSGSCESPITRQIRFTQDEAALSAFIDGLEAGGGTPLSSAIKYANRFLAENRAGSSQNQMIVLLADGAGGCGDVETAMDLLRESGILFRHEAVGLEVGAGSDAMQQLKTIATASGGNHHRANSSDQLGAIFSEAVDNMSMMEMLGGFR